MGALGEARLNLDVTGFQVLLEPKSAKHVGHDLAPDETSASQLGQ